MAENFDCRVGDLTGILTRKKSGAGMLGLHVSAGERLRRKLQGLLSPLIGFQVCNLNLDVPLAFEEAGKKLIRPLYDRAFPHCRAFLGGRVLAAFRLSAPGARPLNRCA
jgi:hypothetical protein